MHGTVFSRLEIGKNHFYRDMLFILGSRYGILISLTQPSALQRCSLFWGWCNRGKKSLSVWNSGRYLPCLIPLVIMQLAYFCQVERGGKNTFTVLYSNNVCAKARLHIF